MTNPDGDEILSQPGWLWWNPSALNLEANWGTRLGFAKNGIEFVPQIQFLTAPGEEYGNEPVITCYAGAYGQIRTEIKNWNTTVLERAFPGLISSNALQFPGTLYAGARLDTSTYAKPLLFMPEDDGVVNQVVLFQMARPGLDETGKIAFSMQEDSAFSLTFDAIRKGAGSDIYRSYYVGPVGGAVLL